MTKGDLCKIIALHREVDTLKEQLEKSDSERIKKKKAEKVAELESLLFSLECFIQSQEDPELRDILRLYYEEGLTQTTIALKLGYSRQAIGMKLKRFFD